MYAQINPIMSSEVKFKEHIAPDENLQKGKVNVTSLVNRLNQEKRKERNSNIALSVAAVSAATVFGIILSL
tara:strand:+ start:414 stop:626 length:213 start_codon:yes stop_codon:yes gene_type:complete